MITRKNLYYIVILTCSSKNDLKKMVDHKIYSFLAIGIFLQYKIFNTEPYMLSKNAL